MRSVIDYSESCSSLQSRASRRSGRRLLNKSRPSNPIRIPVSNYRLPLCISLNFDTVQQADVEAASKLRDIAFATTDQNAQR